MVRLMFLKKIALLSTGLIAAVKTLSVQSAGRLLSGVLAASLLIGCTPLTDRPAAREDGIDGKPVVYQIFTRLFGNRETANIPWGTREQNGTGKFADINEEALASLREMGVTHVWYTGVLHHAMVADYRAYGITSDDPDVVKGRAGSPYAIRDYYDVNPDLALDPAQRLQEFKALIDRTHAQGLKVIIDIVPNHVARRYQSTMKPAGVRDLGADDDTSVAYARDNNFYYVPGEAFQVPDFPRHYQPLGGEAHPLIDHRFDEFPARWTGNGSRLAQPDFNDWYETVKINYGVRPDGSKDFPTLPADFAEQTTAAQLAFWSGQEVPDSWKKFRHIADYWLDMGVDGFRFDMAEMVPVEFWNYLNNAILQRNPEAFLLAEIYNPLAYRDYIFTGRMGYLYDKVGLYDTLRGTMNDSIPADALLEVAADVDDISHAMLNFLENHDEQRIAHPEFAGQARRGWPAMVISSTLNRAAVMIYFGQETGEAALQDMGFGSASRTSIFDYAGVPAHQRWMNDGAWDGGQLSVDEKQLRADYSRLLNLVKTSPALQGDFYDLHRPNVAAGQGYDEQLFAFARWQEQQRLVVVANVTARWNKTLTLQLPKDLIAHWQLSDGEYRLVDLLNPAQQHALTVRDGVGSVPLSLSPTGAVMLSLVQ